MSKKRPMQLAVALAALGAAAIAVAAPKGQAKAPSKVVKRGEYLVLVGGCNDCHTPLKMGPNGPEPDRTKLLAGHPEELKLPPAPAMPEGPWGIVVANTLTAWSGPWGVSFTPNLTPDPETGMGKWTEQDFIAAMRTGRHMGRGRPILPPMPWQALSKLPDEDLRAMFAYLRSIPPIPNRVPEPLPPAAAAR